MDSHLLAFLGMFFIKKFDHILLALLHKRAQIVE